MNQLAFEGFFADSKSTPAPALNLEPELDLDDERLTLRSAPYDLERLLTYVGTFLEWPIAFATLDCDLIVALRNGDEMVLTPKGVKGSIYAFDVEYRATNWNVCYVAADGIIRPHQERTRLGHIGKTDSRILHGYLKARVV